MNCAFFCAMNCAFFCAFICAMNCAFFCAMNCAFFLCFFCAMNCVFFLCFFLCYELCFFLCFFLCYELCFFCAFFCARERRESTKKAQKKHEKISFSLEKMKLRRPDLDSLRASGPANVSRHFLFPTSFPKESIRSEPIPGAGM